MLPIPQPNPRITSKQIAFTSVMCAVANVLGFLTIPIGPTDIHLMQMPIILTGLSLGSWLGGLTGFIGAIVMASRLRPPNPYILLGNAILGFLTGWFYSRIKKMRGKPVIPQLLSVLGAIVVQFPYTYVTDVYLMPMPSQMVLTIILPKIFLEDMISVLLCHVILFRVEIAEILR